MNKKQKLWGVYLGIPFGIGIITCFIVDFALERKLTWSLITAGGCIFAYLFLFMLIFGKKHRVLLAYAVFCVLIIPFLYIIENVSNLYMPKPIYWVTDFGVPITICWLAACAIIALLRKLTKANLWLVAGTSVLAFYCAERFTNYKTDQLWPSSGESWRLSEAYPVIYFGTAAVLIFVGVAVTVIKHLKRD